MFVRSSGSSRLASPTVFALLAVIVGVLSVRTACADTVVCGPITTNTTWNLAGSPYRLTCDVSVLNNAVLTIDPGVFVIFQPSTALVVQTGQLVAEGAFAQNISFKSDDATNRGAGVRVLPSFGGTVSIKFAGFFDLFYGVQISCCGINGPNPPVVIEDSDFQNNIVGVQGYAGGSQAQWSQVTRCIFVGNQTGIDTADKVVSNCSFFSNITAISNIERTSVSDCTFQANTTAISTAGNNYLVEVQRCTITNNINGIVRAATTRRCTITNNTIGATIVTPVIFECNDVHSNSQYNLQLQLGNSVAVANNW